MDAQLGFSLGIRTWDVIGGGGSSLLDNYWSERWRLRREMVEREPVTDLGAFSSDGAVATEWAKALEDLQGAEAVRRRSRPRA